MADGDEQTLMQFDVPDPVPDKRVDLRIEDERQWIGGCSLSRSEYSAASRLVLRSNRFTVTLLILRGADAVPEAKLTVVRMRFGMLKVGQVTWRVPGDTRICDLEAPEEIRRLLRLGVDQLHERIASWRDAESERLGAERELAERQAAETHEANVRRVFQD